MVAVVLCVTVCMGVYVVQGWWDRKGSVYPTESSPASFSVVPGLGAPDFLTALSKLPSTSL